MKNLFRLSLLLIMILFLSGCYPIKIREFESLKYNNIIQDYRPVCNEHGKLLKNFFFVKEIDSEQWNLFHIRNLSTVYPLYIFSNPGSFEYMTSKALFPIE